VTVSIRLPLVAVVGPLLDLALRVEEVEDHGLHGLRLLRMTHLLKLHCELVYRSAALVRRYARLETLH